MAKGQYRRTKKTRAKQSEKMKSMWKRIKRATEKEGMK